ncbi:MAG: class I SAM-dependent methyltransferase [Proteobacteria bacterium]|nr:class I SAM-dependent methyltransferase [Pseudomonadota bacterium]
MKLGQQTHPHWMAMSFLLMINIFPSLKPKLWGWLYNKIASLDSSGNFLFMNYGYYEENKCIELRSEDEPFRCAIQLYNHVTENIVLLNKDVLEMGCGRGGGGSFFLRYKNLRSYVGVDLSRKAIQWCQRQHAYDNARWLQGSAECIPVPDSSIDIVTNVESSHCYPSMANFVQEVKRILRLNGYFAICDLRPKGKIQSLDQTMNNSGLTILKREDITFQVIKALDVFSQSRKLQIAAVFPSIFQHAINDFAAIKNTGIYNKLKSGELVYVSYLLQKQI